MTAAEVSVSWARVICDWTDRLPEGDREEADRILLDAARSGLDLRDVTALAAEMYEKSRPQPSEDEAGPGAGGPVGPAGDHIPAAPRSCPAT